MQSAELMESIRNVMKAESTNKKLSFAGQSLVWFIFFSSVGGVYLAWYANASKINNAYCDGSNDFSDDLAQTLQQYCGATDSKVYDVEFLWWAQAGFDSDQTWTDLSEAQNLYGDIIKLSNEERALGARFSMIY